MSKLAIKNNKLENNNSLFQLADNLVLETNNFLPRAKTEEDLRIRFEKLLDPIKFKLGIRSEPKYEKSVFKGRSDAMHGQVVIEYEPPRSFSSKRNIDHAYKQITDYLSGESKASRLSQLVGIGFDGERIFFVQYQAPENIPIDESKFALLGPYEFNSESARTF